ncbi:MAG: hypothetical protein PHX79_07135 [Sphaerochaetaceae bacterium]|nr:hypothetical protein [Sphaerochaetaceae bacterium]
MAELTFSIPDDIYNKLQQLRNTAEYAPKMIEAEQDAVFPEVMRRLEPHSHNKQAKADAGALKASMVKTKPKMDKSGRWRAKIKPSGYDKKGVSNNQKLLSLEYGTSKQLATPVLRPARQAMANQAMEAAQKVFNEAVSK